MKNDRYGFGALEALAGTSIIALMAYLGSGMFVSLFKTQNRLRGSVEFTTFIQSLSRGLQTDASCSGAFRNAADTGPLRWPNRLPLNIESIHFGSIRFFAVSRPNLLNGVTITRLQFDNATLLGSRTIGSVVYDRYLANLHVEATRRQVHGNLTHNHLIPLLVNRSNQDISMCENEMPVTSTASREIALDNPAPGWKCLNDIDLTDVCMGRWGCKFQLRLQNLAYYDYASFQNFYLYTEQPDLSNKVWAGTHVSVGSNYSAIRCRLGTADRCDLWNAWDIWYLKNYVHGWCPGQRGNPDRALPEGHFSILLGGYFKMRLLVTRIE